MLPEVHSQASKQLASSVMLRRASHVLNNCSCRYNSKSMSNCMSTLTLSSILRCSKRQILVFLLCHISIVTLACAPAGGKNYFPLTDGAKWVYVGRTTSDNKPQISFHAIARIEGETLINGRRYFKFVTTVDSPNAALIGKSLEDVRYYRVADDGIYVRPGVDPDKPDLLELPLPIPIGQSWLSGATEVKAERAGIITVGGREYKDCLKITFKLADGLRTTENYHVPGVGIIKTVYVNNTEPKSVVELTLEKYEP